MEILIPNLFQKALAGKLVCAKSKHDPGIPRSFCSGQSTGMDRAEQGVQDAQGPLLTHRSVPF